MSTAILDRTADTDHPVMEVLADRWSPRAFDTELPIDEQKLASALEAARWAPSANNSQPWRFLVARRGTALHNGIQAALMGFNQTWAPHAAALIVAIAETETEDGQPVPFAAYDLGQAVAHLSVQAHHDGLVVHQMGGFDREAVRALSGLDERFVPLTVVALGELGDLAALPEALQERETAPRTRRPLVESVVAAA
ncbi:nitroreductase family protein [Microbacterium capsulatum]|uniref:Nitroreductase family protein n=1 Tax=Microbacterium capsulatum TaxID=3041921 RepID=A0ABU0XEF2_9MICO|nr:nitroreductase family protein [Microbacterium sp. ASV81]MDQ4213441.1 nitroreductase family protein [Microbacterium sp. ASV81]